jgi:protocatechuate 3,4-dioxygenase beta subunit
MTSLKTLFRSTLILTIALLFLGAAQGQTIDSKPKATGSISGRVTVSGKGAAGIAVTAISADNLNRRAGTARAMTDNEGYYRLSDLAPAQYQVAPLTPEMTTAETELEPNFGYVYLGASKNIVLAAGETVENVDVKLVRGSVITGRVTDADNKPVIEERVSLQPVDENGNPPKTPVRNPTGSQMYQTDDRGTYRIYGLSAGHYKVSIGNDPGGGVSFNSRRYYPRTYYPNTTDVAKASIVDVAEGGEAPNIDIQVGDRSDTYTVSGRMVDSETGLPISGVRVGSLIKRQNEQRYQPFMVMWTTGAQGEFRLEGFAPGKYGAFAANNSDGGDLYSDPVYFEITDKDVSGLEIKTMRGLSVSGVVAGDVQAPKELLAQLQGLRISAIVDPGTAASAYSSATATVTPDGTFQINGLRPGRVSIGLYALNGKRPSIVRIDHQGIGNTQGFELQAGQSVSGLRVTITYGNGVIRGSVRYEGGTPAPQTRTFVSCVRDGDRENTGAQIDSRGHFVISGLSPGIYNLMLQTAAPGQRPSPPQKQSVTVTNDAESQVDFVVDLTPKEGKP